MKTSHLGYMTNASVIQMLEDLKEHVAKDEPSLRIVAKFNKYIEEVQNKLKHNEKTISFAVLKSDATMWEPIDALVEAMNGLGKERDRKPFRAFSKETKKLVVIALDDKEDDYNVSYIQAGMRTSELLSLIAVAETTFLRVLGHLE